MIKLLTIKHIEKYKDLRLLSLKTDPISFASTYDFEKDKPDTFFRNKIVYSIKAPIFGVYGYFEKEKLVGTAQLGNSYYPKRCHVAHIYEVYVHPDFRRKNIATKLMKDLIAKVENDPQVEILELKVNSKNTDAVAFYESLGFTKNARLKNVVKEPNGSYQDELVYSLKV